MNDRSAALADFHCRYVDGRKAARSSGSISLAIAEFLHLHQLVERPDDRGGILCLAARCVDIANADVEHGIQECCGDYRRHLNLSTVLPCEIQDRGSRMIRAGLPYKMITLSFSWNRGSGPWVTVSSVPLVVETTYSIPG